MRKIRFKYYKPEGYDSEPTNISESKKKSEDIEKIIRKVLTEKAIKRHIKTIIKRVNTNK